MVSLSGVGVVAVSLLMVLSVMWRPRSFFACSSGVLSCWLRVALVVGVGVRGVFFFFSVSCVRVSVAC